ncbi:uncharacterized protein LOC117175159 [Belonocnema kinseyi]|uniref:uncharacterized protein LOC117175159 n=1 Tax=Belonocnema kinseyi TaxID=2817044 RepID=UPI00143D14AC|nr:uncharacterized protein LOC117175159 [Belonocnema kinseyi]
MAPVPKKELMAKSRDMKRQDPEKWDEYLRKNRQRNIIARSKKRLTMCEEEKHAHREKEKLRKRAQRLKKKISTPTMKASIITKKEIPTAVLKLLARRLRKLLVNCLLVLLRSKQLLRNYFSEFSNQKITMATGLWWKKAKQVQGGK